MNRLQPWRAVVALLCLVASPLLVHVLSFVQQSSFGTRRACPSERSFKWVLSSTEAREPAREPVVKLLDGPPPHTEGSFVEPDGGLALMCVVYARGLIDDKEYAIGFPTELGVLITRREGELLVPVAFDDEDFFDVFTFVQNQLMHNDVDLHLTPRVLTMTGDFDFDDPLTFDEWQALDDEESAEQFEARQTSFVEDGEDAEVDLSNPDISVLSRDVAEDMSRWLQEDEDDVQITEDMLVDVSPEGQARFKEEYETVSELCEESEDVDLVATLQYKKGFLHVVRLLETPLFVGQRRTHMKGMFYTLLSEEEEEAIAPHVREISRLKEEAWEQEQKAYQTEKERLQQVGGGPKGQKLKKRGFTARDRDEGARRFRDPELDESRASPRSAPPRGPKPPPPKSRSAWKRTTNSKPRD